MRVDNTPPRDYARTCGMLLRLTLLLALAALAASQNSCPISQGVATCVYTSTGAEQTFTVPNGVTQVPRQHVRRR